MAKSTEDQIVEEKMKQIISMSSPTGKSIDMKYIRNLITDLEREDIIRTESQLIALFKKFNK